MVFIRNKTVGRLVYDRYDLQQLEAIWALLKSKGTFSFPHLPNGLYPAHDGGADSAHTGYQNVWIRDNVYIALAHYENGEVPTAIATLTSLAQFLLSQTDRFQAVVSDPKTAAGPMNRPHIRFDGRTLSELPQKWPHAQNDALGYFVWLFCRVHREQRIDPSPDDWTLLSLCVAYWQAIRYWRDADSGHWEEARKVEASSIGAVVAALLELEGLAEDRDSHAIPLHTIRSMIAEGRRALSEILPSESIEPSERARRYDSALLFLIYPLRVIEGDMAQTIMDDVIANLRGTIGIKRYPGDSFWAPNYKDLFPPDERTADFSDKIEVRDRFFAPGDEAEWCIFDSIVSIVFGLRYAESGAESHRNLQMEYFNRALGQITEEDHPLGGFRCPELYYVENGKRATNDIVPLLWAQANLWLAFMQLRKTLLRDPAR